ncbi:hypothetical protein [Legionella sp. WA2024007413]
MNGNINRIYIFVKGNKGKAGFLIADNNFNEIYKDVVESFSSEGKLFSALHSDYKAVVESLNYVKIHRGNNSIPVAPVVFVFTNTENNYHVSIDSAKARKPEVEQFKYQIDELVKDLRRTERDNNVKFVYFPKNFINLMPQLESMLEEKKQMQTSTRNIY